MNSKKTCFSGPLGGHGPVAPFPLCPPLPCAHPSDSGTLHTGVISPGGLPSTRHLNDQQFRLKQSRERRLTQEKCKHTTPRRVCRKSLQAERVTTHERFVSSRRARCRAAALLAHDSPHLAWREILHRSGRPPRLIPVRAGAGGLRTGRADRGGG